jgi:serine/threonine protein kinase
MPSNEDTQLLNTGDFIEPWRGVNAPESSDDLVGVTLNDTYVVERLLGEGGMGRVYLARHTRIAQKRVAVKVLHPEFASNQQVLARFQREAEAAAAITHPNVVAVLDIDVTPRGMPYLVCEYMEGIDLADHLHEVKRLDVLDALSVTRQLCRGLYAAHSRGVIHRDLKPPNVFLVGNFSKGAPPRLVAKILDFGLSSFRATEEGGQSLTKTGVIMGTPSYMAPEQARGKRVDHRADVYGLGTILYTVLTGRAPYDEESPQATILALLNSEPPRPRSLVGSIPPHLELVIERAMAKNPDDRYPDMQAFEQALDALPAAKALTQSVQPAALVAATPKPAIAHASASDADVHAARPRLLLSLLCAVLLLIAGAIVAISGLELAIGYSFGKVELRLILLAIVGTAFTPAALWFFHIRRKIWDSSSRVLSLLDQVRAAVLTGIIGYGLLVLLSHVVDDFLLRFLGNAQLKPVGVTWTGWNLLLPAVALIGGVTVAYRRRLLSGTGFGWRRLVAAWLAVGLGVVLGAGVIYFGILWQAALAR